MPRTAEQQAADEALATAVHNVLIAYSLHPSDSMITDYLVLAASQRIGEDGDGFTKYNWISQGEGAPWHTLFGLMDVSRQIMEGQRAESAIPDDEE